MSPRRAYVDTPNGQIHYLTAGEGRPVLFLHQTPRSSDEFLEVLPIVGQRFKAIAMDSIGFGFSYKSDKKCSIENLGSGVIEFMDAMGMKDVLLVGHHTGAVVALEVAASHPTRVDRLVLSACPFYDETLRASLHNKPVMDADEETEDGAFLLSLWKRRMEFYPKGRTDLLKRFIIDALLARENRVQGHVAVREYPIEKSYGKVSCSTLLVCGTADPFSYPAMSKVADRIKNCETVTIEGGTVAMPDQMPTQFANSIIPFLTKP